MPEGAYPPGHPARRFSAQQATAHKPADRLMFDVRVTAYDAGTASYTWARVFPAGDGTFYDDPAGVTGGPTYAPLKERNGQVVSSFPFYAKAELRIGVTPTTGPVYEFTASGASGSFKQEWNQDTTITFSPGSPYTYTDVLTTTDTGLHLIAGAVTANNVAAIGIFASCIVAVGTTGTATLYQPTQVSVTIPVSSGMVFPLSQIVNVTSAPCTFSVTLSSVGGNGSTSPGNGGAALVKL